MATYNGVVGQQTISSKTVTDSKHPAVIRLMEFKADNGIIKAGEIIALNAAGQAVSYDPSAEAPVNVPAGVCTEDIDTSISTAGSAAIHATVVGDALTVKGTKADADALNALESAVPVWIF